MAERDSEAKQLARWGVIMAEVDAKEIAKVSDAIARPAVRKMFALDPISALERAGVDLSKVPKETVDVLASLAPWELEVLGRAAELARAKGIEGALADHVGVIIH